MSLSFSRLLTRCISLHNNKNIFAKTINKAVQSEVFLLLLAIRFLNCFWCQSFSSLFLFQSISRAITTFLSTIRDKFNNKKTGFVYSFRIDSQLVFILFLFYFYSSRAIKFCRYLWILISFYCIFSWGVFCHYMTLYYSKKIIF